MSGTAPHAPQYWGPPPPVPPRPAPRARLRVTLWLLRIVLTIQALALAAQPVLIGGYLEGNFDLITAHGLNGSVLIPWGMLAGGLTLAHLLAGGGVWPFAVANVLWLAEGVQVGMGYSRTLLVHVPLGVALVAAGAALAVWVWTPGAGRPRGTP